MSNKINQSNPEAPFEGLVEGIHDQAFDDAIHISAVDFKLEHSKLAQINRGLNDLYQLAPINSQIKLEFKSILDTFEGKLEVLSASRNFSATATSPNLETLYNEMEKSVLIEISDWKKNRFKNY